MYVPKDYTFQTGRASAVAALDILYTGIMVTLVEKREHIFATQTLSLAQLSKGQRERLSTPTSILIRKLTTTRALKRAVCLEIE